MKDLIVRVQLGEQGAYEDVIKAFQDMAVGYGYAMLGDVQLAEDVAQEAFIQAYYRLRYYGTRAIAEMDIFRMQR